MRDFSAGSHGRASAARPLAPLIEAGVVKGREMTSWPSPQTGPGLLQRRWSRSSPRAAISNARRRS